jgi:hypothetical protein
MGKLSTSRLALAIAISGIFLFPPTDSFAAKKIWLERQLEKLFSLPQHKAPKRRKPRRAASAAARQSDEIRLPDTAPLPESAPLRVAAAPSPPETVIPVPEDKPPPPVEGIVAQDDVHPSDKPLEIAPAEPPKPEFRPDKPAPTPQTTPGLPAETPAEKPEPRPEEEPAGPLDAAPEPPKPEFRPDKPPPEAAEPKAAEPAEPPPPPDPRSALRPDPSGKLPDGEIACRQRLAELGVKFDNYPAEAEPTGCSIPYPLVLKSLGTTIGLTPQAEMNCATAEAAARFARDVISPAAQDVFGQPLKSITHASAYVCRPRNGTRKLSEHAFGNALDISSFTLSDGTTVAVELTPPEKNGIFVDKVRRAACGPFKTVLGPGAPDHSEHLHFDLAPRRHGGTVCE